MSQVECKGEKEASQSIQWGVGGGLIPVECSPNDPARIRRVPQIQASKKGRSVSHFNGAMDCYLTVQQSGKEVTHRVHGVVTDGAILGINIPPLNCNSTTLATNRACK